MVTQQMPLWAAALALLAGCVVPIAPTGVPSPTPRPPATPEPLPTATAVPPSPTPRPTPAPADIFDLARRIGRGVNLGNALEAPAEGEWGWVIADADFALIRAAGFTAVRIPVRWSAHMLAGEPYSIDPAFFARLDHVIGQALAAGLVAIVNVHHFDELDANPAGQRARFVALWRQVGQRYAALPHALVFELYNEPHDALLPGAWNALVAETLTAVRETNPNRAIVINAANYANVTALADLKLPAADRNLIIGFHYYAPFRFTHQGAEWVDGSAAWLGTEWLGSSPERGAIEFDLDQAAAAGRAAGRPVLMGEFGAYGKGDMASRARWTAFVARESERRGMSWAYWEYAAGFGVRDREAGAWRAPLITALLP